MKLEFCAACAERDTDRLEHHHLVPRSAGGGDDERNLITLCHECHGRAHGVIRRDVRALTKAGLVAAKARGTVLGGFRGKNFTEADHAAAKQARTAAAVARGADLAQTVREMQAAGANTLGALAKALTAAGIETARGKATWSPMQVSRLLATMGG